MSKSQDIGPAGERLKDINLKSPNLVECPYDPVHHILPSRLYLHLKKCRDRHPHSNLQICPFQFLHHIPEHEMDHHKTVCEDRFSAVQSIICTDENTNAERVETPIIPSAESWEDADFETYDPRKVNENRIVLIPCKGLSRTQNLKYREESRLKNSRIAESAKKENKTHPQSSTE